MTRAERKAGEFLKRLERGAGGDRRSDKIKNSNVEYLISEYSDVLAGEFLKRLERKQGQRVDKLNSNVELSSSEYSDVLKEYAIPTTSAHRWQQTKPTLAVGFLLATHSSVERVASEYSDVLKD